jgi:predicted amidophosphoribosyltransferase
MAEEEESGFAAMFGNAGRSSGVEAFGKSTVCKKCGAENKLGAKVCESCGAELEVEAFDPLKIPPLPKK